MKAVHGALGVQHFLRASRGVTPASSPCLLLSLKVDSGHVYSNGASLHVPISYLQQLSTSITSLHTFVKQYLLDASLTLMLGGGQVNEESEHLAFD